MAELAADVVESVPAGPDLALGHSLGGAVLTKALPGLAPARAIYTVARLGFRVARVREVSHLMFFDDPEQCVAIVAEFAAR
jgi:hypothetical protein